MTTHLSLSCGGGGPSSNSVNISKMSFNAPNPFVTEVGVRTSSFKPSPSSVTHGFARTQTNDGLSNQQPIALNPGSVSRFGMSTTVAPTIDPSPFSGSAPSPVSPATATMVSHMIVEELLEPSLPSHSCLIDRTSQNPRIKKAMDIACKVLQEEKDAYKDSISNGNHTNDFHSSEMVERSPARRTTKSDRHVNNDQFWENQLEEEEQQIKKGF